MDANLAYTDWQLDLPNGLKLVRDILDSVSRPSLIVFEVNSLREINEICGRHVGDQLLMDIRTDFYKHAPPSLTLYRISGNKFCITSYELKQDDLLAYATDFSKRLEGPWSVHYIDSTFNVTCETTLAVILTEYINKEESPLNVVERTLKAAKDSAESILVYDEHLDKIFKRRRQFEFSLKRCVSNRMEGFNVFYQPLANPVTGVWCGLEALCRWTSPEIGFVSPTEFIAESERLALIDTIGLWVLEMAVRQCKAWGLDKLRAFILDVNVSAIQFTDADLAKKIIGILNKYDYPGDRLCLEITESTQFTFNGPAMATFKKLRAKHIAIALDDFGTGYSAFNKLKELPVDIVKIERVFVADIENDSYLRYLFRAIAELVHTADMRIVAEGVETKEQMNILLEHGADMMQGYLFSKPIDSSEMSKKLHLFHKTDLELGLMHLQKIDMNALLSNVESYVLTPKLNRTMFRCTYILLHNEDLDEAIHEVLGIVGKAIGVSRVYIFEHITKNNYSNTFEWCAAGIKPQKENQAYVPLDDACFNIMKNEGILIATDINDLPESIRALLQEQDVKSVAVIPIWEKKTVTRFIGFDECIEYRNWWPEEMLILYNICLTIASVIKRLKKQHEAFK
jgi:EAL domain-containing protein (putative c-di-GMP-specific phosphodiesterase class I)